MKEGTCKLVIGKFYDYKKLKILTRAYNGQNNMRVYVALWSKFSTKEAFTLE